MTQLELYREDPVAQLFRVLRRIVALNGHTKVSEALGISGPALSHILARSRTAHGRLKRLLSIDRLHDIVMLDGGDELVHLVCSWRGGEFLAHRPASDAELGRALLQVAQTELGPSMRKGLLSAAKERILENRRLLAGGEDDE